MEQEEIQELWDMQLIAGWKANIPMSWMVVKFLKLVNPSLLTDKGAFKTQFIDLKETINYIESLELHRCCDDDGKGGLGFYGIRGPVRAFISKRSEILSNCLWNEDNSVVDIIDSIDNFKWKDARKLMVSNSRERVKRKYDEDKIIKIKARKLDTSHEWKTVT